MKHTKQIKDDHKCSCGKEHAPTLELIGFFACLAICAFVAGIILGLGIWVVNAVAGV